MIPMKTEFFTYQEVLDVYPLRAPSNPYQSGLSAEWFSNLLGDLSLQYTRYGISSTITDLTIKAIVNALMTNVYDRHAEDYIFHYDSLVTEANHTLTSSDVKKAISKILGVLNLTLPKYISLFQQYETASENPIAPAKSESSGETRFNDTPQNIGEFGDEDHTTNISNSKSESKVDTGSLMERLTAMFKDFKSIILEWSNEFNQLFIKEVQIYE